MKITPQVKNANRHTARGMQALETSIATDGWIGAITVAADGETFDGSARVEKTAENGMLDDALIIDIDGTKPVVLRRTDIPSATDPRAVRLGIAANRVASLNLEWEPDVLAGVIASGVELSPTLFTADEWAEVSLVQQEETQEDEPVSVDTSQPTRCQPGDIWRVGRHTVACMDSTDVAALDRVVISPPQMVWSDAPYGIDIVAADVSVGGGERYDYPFGGVKKNPNASATKRGTIGGDKPFGSARRVVGTDGADNIVRAGRYAPVAGDDSTETAHAAASLLLTQYPDAVHIWWGANHFSDAFPPSSCWLVWDKENTGNFADAELAWCSDDSAVRIFRHMWNGMLRASEHGKRIHPTQKPIALCEWAFEKYGSVGDVILDPFLGSAPSLKAAEKMGRTVIGFELSPHYIDHVLEWGEAHGLEVKRIDG